MQPVHAKPNWPRLLRVAVVLSSVALAGCTVPPPPPAASVADEALTAAGKPPPQWTNPADAAAVSTGWVTRFHDQTLSALVSEAFANNNDLKVATARVDEAREALVIAGSPLFPAVGLDAGAHNTHDGSSGATCNNSGASLTAVWEPDVWGKIRSGQAGAFAQNETFARMAIASLVARGWYTCIGLKQSIALTRTQVDNYAEHWILCERRMKPV